MVGGSNYLLNEHADTKTSMKVDRTNNACSFPANCTRVLWSGPQSLRHKHTSRRHRDTWFKRFESFVWWKTNDGAEFITESGILSLYLAQLFFFNRETTRRAWSKWRLQTHCDATTCLQWSMMAWSVHFYFNVCFRPVVHFSVFIWKCFHSLVWFCFHSRYNSHLHTLTCTNL